MSHESRDSLQKIEKKLKELGKVRVYRFRLIGVCSRRSFTPWTRDEGTHGRVRLGRHGCQTSRQVICLPSSLAMSFTMSRVWPGARVGVRPGM